MEDIIIFLGIAFNLNLPLLTAWLLDHWLGDPVWLPHPVVAFGKAISFCEHRLNKGNARFLKGAVMSLVLVAGVYLLTLFLLRWAAHYSPGLLFDFAGAAHLLLPCGYYAGARSLRGV